MLVISVQTDNLTGWLIVYTFSNLFDFRGFDYTGLLVPLNICMDYCHFIFVCVCVMLPYIHTIPPPSPPHSYLTHTPHSKWASQKHTLKLLNPWNPWKSATRSGILETFMILYASDTFSHWTMELYDDMLMYWTMDFNYIN